VLPVIDRLLAPDVGAELGEGLLPVLHHTHTKQTARERSSSNSQAGKKACRSNVSSSPLTMHNSCMHTSHMPCISAALDHTLLSRSNTARSSQPRQARRSPWVMAPRWARRRAAVLAKRISPGSWLTCNTEHSRQGNGVHNRPVIRATTRRRSQTGSEVTTRQPMQRLF
jgi:hypothetical protein